jgi:hypothetical protein
MTAARLRALPAGRIISAIADAAQRWSDADFPPRVRATRAIEERLRYSEPVVDYALDRLFRPVTAEALRAVIEDELGAVAALDGFAERPNRPPAFARGVANVTIVSSDTTIGVALWPALFALCAKSQVVVKDRSDELIAAFAKTLCEEDEAFASAFVAEQWDEHDDPLTRQRLAQAGVVMAFGRDSSLAAIRAHCDPSARFFGLGHRTSVAYIEAGALGSPTGELRAARGLARDALLYDGDGCLSIHCAFIECDAAMQSHWRATLSQAMDEASVEFPPVLSASERKREAFLESQPAGAAPGRSYLLTVDAPPDAFPPLEPRTLAVRFVNGPDDVRAYLERHKLPLEAFGLVEPATASAAATDVALASGAARVARIGDLQAPELASNHGGDGRITPFIEWVVRDRE